MPHAKGLANGNVSRLEQVRQRREKAGKLGTGIAPVSNSDMFKGPTKGKPSAKNWDSHFSQESGCRPPCLLKQASAYLKTPGLISLGGGLPSSEYFPFSKITIQVPAPPNFSELDPETNQTAEIGKYDVKNGTSEFDLSIALNYGQAMGSAQLMRWVTEHTEIVFNPPYADWGCVLTPGSTASLEQITRMLCDSGSSILTEEYTFATALQTFTPQGVRPVAVKMDEQGMLPSDLEHVLSSWNPNSGRKPHVLYTVPSGQNPTGATQKIERRRAIYDVCQKHNVIIIEDEPYYFLQMDPYKGDTTPSSNTDDFLEKLIPSYLSLDTDGRVIRLDSFSKVLVPGSRVGWVTASKQIIQRFIPHAEVANQGPSGMAQIILWKLLDEVWGHEGYLRWLMDLRNNYTRRRNTLLDACEQFLPKDLVSWTPPDAGMFLWLKLDHTKHPEYPHKDNIEIEEEIFHHAIDNGVLFARGSWFRAEPGTKMKDLFLRVTFASASEDAMSTAIQRLGVAICKTFLCE